MDIAKLGLAVDSGPVRQATDALNKFKRGADDAGEAADYFQDAAGRWRDSSGKFVNATDRARLGLDNLGGSSGKVGGSIKAMAAQMAAAIGVTATLHKTIGAADQYTNMQNRLLALGASHESAAAQIRQLGDIALATRAPLESTVELYSRLSLTSESLGASQAELMEFTETVGLALAASGTTAAQASGALTQLSQAMAGGIVRAEEFNSMIEGAPGLLMAVANGIEGVNGDLGALRQMMLDGELTSESFFNALLSQNEALQQSFGNTAPTIASAFTAINNEFTLFIGSADQATGVTSAIAEAMLLLAENMDVAVPVFGAVAIGVAAISAPVLAAGVAIGALAVAVITHWDEIKAAFKDGVDAVLNAVSGFADMGRQMIAAFRDAWNSVLAEIAGWPGDLYQVGKDAVAGLVAGLLGQSETVGSAARKLGRDAERAIRDETETRSPSRVFMRIGGDLVDGLVLGIDQKDRDILERAAQLGRESAEGVQIGWQDNEYLITDAIETTVDWMIDGFQGGFDSLKRILLNSLKEMARIAIGNPIKIALTAGLTGGAGAASAGVPSMGGGGMLSNLLPGVFGGGGALGGIGSGLMGVFSGGGLGSSFANLGGLLSGSVSGWGAVGAALPAAGVLVGVPLLLGALFKKTEVLVAEGVRARIEGASLELDSYEKTKTNNGLGISSGFSRDFERLDDAVQSAVQTRLDATITALEQFGFGTDLTGFSFSKRTEIKDGETFEGESEEVIREALDAVTQYLADGALEVFMQAGETVSMTLERLSTSLAATNQSLDFFGGTLLPISLDGASAAAALTDLYGGLENFAASGQFLFENFYTDAEKMERATAELNAAFADLGVAVPETHDAYRDLINSQDLMTEGGRELHASLGALAPLFTAVAGTADEAAAELAEYEAGLQESIRLRAEEKTAMLAANRAREAAIRVAEKEARRAQQQAELDATAAANEATFAENVNRYAAQVSSGIRSMEDVLRNVPGATKEAIEAAYQNIGVVDRIDAYFNQPLGTVGGGAWETRGGVDIFNQMANEILSTAMDNAVAVFDRAGEDISRFVADYGDGPFIDTQQVRDAAAALEGLTDARSGELAAMEQAVGTLDTLRGALAALDEGRFMVGANAAGVVMRSAGLFRAAMSELAGEAGDSSFDTATRGIDKLTEVFKALAPAMQAGSAINQVPDGYRSFVAQQAFGDAEMLNVIKSVSEQAKAIIEQAIVAPIEKQIAIAAPELEALAGEMFAPIASLASEVSKGDAQAYGDAILSISNMFASGKIDLDTYQASFGLLNSALNGSLQPVEGLTDAVSGLSDALDAESNALRQSVDDARNALARSLDAETQRLEGVLSGLQSQRDSLYDQLFPQEAAQNGLEIRDFLSDGLDLAKRLSEIARDVLGQNVEIAEQQREAALRQLQGMLAAGAIDVDNVQDIARRASEFNSRQYATLEDMQFDQLVTANTITELAKLQEKLAQEAQAKEEARVAAARDLAFAQIDLLDQQIAEQQNALAQLDDIREQNGITVDTLMSIAEAQVKLDDAERYASTREAQLEAIRAEFGILGDVFANGLSEIAAATGQAIQAARDARATINGGQALRVASPVAFVTQAQAAPGMLVPSYANGTDYHPGGWAKQHENEMVNLPRGTSVSTASEVRQMAEQNKRLEQQNEQNAAELRQMRRFLKTLADIEEDRRAEELAKAQEEAAA